MTETIEKRQTNPGFYDGLGFYKLVYVEMERINLAAYMKDYSAWSIGLRNYRNLVENYLKEKQKINFDKLLHNVDLNISFMQCERAPNIRSQVQAKIYSQLCVIQRDLYSATSHVHLPKRQENNMEGIQEGSFL